MARNKREDQAGGRVFPPIGGEAAVITGTSTNDVVHRQGDGQVAGFGETEFATATTGADRIDTGNGDDRVYADGGNDRVTLGDGNDSRWATATTSRSAIAATTRSPATTATTG